jgi:hypothetical protein
LLRSAPPARLRYRVRARFSDDDARSGVREELIEFSDPRRALDLMRRVAETPDRPVLSIHIESFVKPQWYGVPEDFLIWRAQQRARRDQQREELDRAAEQSRGTPGGAR